MSELLARVSRGGIAESLHSGDIVVSDSRGRAVLTAGDPSVVTYWRSASKPMQAVPIVTTGASARFGFTSSELALMTASHSGQAEHVAVVRSILAKAGVAEGDLRCGTHPPFHQPTSDAMIAKGESFTELGCNCSGKHAAMLALAAHMGASLTGYWKMSHPVQQAMLDEVSHFGGVEPEQIHVGVDGCGVPVFASSLLSMATAYARLVTGEELAPARAQAALTVSRAMMDNPFMVAGTGRTCTDFMSALPGRIVAKDGAEGVYCLGLPGPGLGVAVKVKDGSQRAIGPICVSILRRLGVFGSDEMALLAALSRVRLLNLRGEEVGDIVSTL